MRCLIYGLVDPRTLLVRYVGQTTVGLERPRSHRRVYYSQSHLYIYRWIAQLRRLDLEYQIVVLDECLCNELDTLERWWISYGLACGWPLTNATAGNVYRPRSAQRPTTKTGARKTGDAFAQGWRTRRERYGPSGLAVKRLRHTAKTRAKIAAAARGRVMSKETTEKIWKTRRERYGMSGSKIGHLP